MDEIKLQLPDGRISRILIGESIDHLTKYTLEKNILILTDPHVASIYEDRFPKDVPVIKMPGGETNKSLATLQFVISQMIHLGVDREWFIVGIGGGIVCDLTGFIASVFMRGVRFGFVASTLLAQVDASVGGKNGVNFEGYKNMVGVFNQPDFVICETSMLNTLDVREVKAGLAEVVKSALLADRNLFCYLQKHTSDILNQDSFCLNHLVKRSVEIKAAVVQADEREAGERRKLNLGHTLGHAVEKNDNLLHGEAVSIGLSMVAKWSSYLGLITESERNEIIALLESLGLPTETSIPKEKLLSSMQKDKKKQGSTIHFIYNKGIGEAIVKKITYQDLESFLNLM